MLLAQFILATWLEAVTEFHQLGVALFFGQRHGGLNGLLDFVSPVTQVLHASLMCLRSLRLQRACIVTQRGSTLMQAHQVRLQSVAQEIAGGLRCRSREGWRFTAVQFDFAFVGLDGLVNLVRQGMQFADQGLLLLRGLLTVLGGQNRAPQTLDLLDLTGLQWSKGRFCMNIGRDS